MMGRATDIDVASKATANERTHSALNASKNSLVGLKTALLSIISTAPPALFSSVGLAGVVISSAVAGARVDAPVSEPLSLSLSLSLSFAISGVDDMIGGNYLLLRSDMGEKECRISQ